MSKHMGNKCRKNNHERKAAEAATRQEARNERGDKGQIVKMSHEGFTKCKEYKRLTKKK